jgi:hypothetical protein
MPPMPKPAPAATEPAASEPRIWDSPVGAGEPVPFDPTLHQPGLSPEEIEAMLGKEEG